MNENTIKSRYIRYTSRIIKFIIRNIKVLLMALPFIAMDLVTRAVGYKVSFFHIYSIQPALFTLCWVFLFVGLTLSVNKTAGKIIYLISFLISFILFLTNVIYYPMTKFFFNFSLLQMAGEGSSYIWDTIIHTNPIFFIIAVIIIALAVLAFLKLPVREKTSYKSLIKISLIFLVLHALLSLTFGKAYSTLTWDSFKNPANVYKEFSDSNKCMKISGLYEYSVRNFYVTYLRPEEKISDEDEKFLSDIYNGEDKKTNNNYTGLFKGKNVIFLQLEGMDNWLLNEENTPNLYNLQKHSINFTDHYSIYTGGGSTFNSEFAVNTGFTTPVSYNKNVYSFNHNTFDNGLAKLFKRMNYNVNSFHMNSGDFYSRAINYKNWGYDNYYGLLDIKNYTNLDYELDTELINNKTFYDKMFKQEGNFLDYIITYSPHTPFRSTGGVCKLILQKEHPNEELPELDKEECVKIMVGETDKMIGQLIQALKDNNLYDNTVIVAYADHYLYTINDISILAKYKETDNNLINNTPFFIWSSDIEAKDINVTTSQLNILPTVLNLFGIDYNSNNYIAKDSLSPEYDPHVFFSDYSWYDGNVYVENNSITNGGSMDLSELKKKSEMINNIIKKNDLTLKYDYFKPKK